RCGGGPIWFWPTPIRRPARAARSKCCWRFRMPTRRVEITMRRRIVLIASLLASGIMLGGCSTFDPTEWFNTKKPLPGERKDMFPGGVPGVPQGVPPELVEGYREPEPPPPRVVEEKPKPKPKPKPRPQQAAAPRAAPPQQQQAAPAQSPSVFPDPPPQR